MFYFADMGMITDQQNIALMRPKYMTLRQMHKIMTFCWIKQIFCIFPFSYFKPLFLGTSLIPDIISISGKYNSFHHTVKK
jgi:hypothetical protein